MYRLVLSLTLASCAARVQAPTTMSSVDLADFVLNSTVYIQTVTDAQEVGTGSGFFVGPHTVISAKHVVDNSAGSRIHAVLTRTGEECGVAGVFMLPDADAAVLRVTGCTAPAVVRTFDTESPQGTEIMLAGHPLGFSWSVTNGILQKRAMTGSKWGEIMLVTAPALAGASGGPIVDYRGRLVGMMVALHSADDIGALWDGLTIAVSAKQVQAALDAAGSDLPPPPPPKLELARCPQASYPEPSQPTSHAEDVGPMAESPLRRTWPAPCLDLDVGGR